MNHTDHKVSDHFPDVRKMDKHLMNYTDEQLKATLAKMLPELLYIDYFEAKFISIRWLTNKPNYGRKGIPVLDTELLHLCWLVEEEVFRGKSFEYIDALHKVTFFSDFIRIHATWQNRVEALAKVKGIEI
jgi:hypothetical protein